MLQARILLALSALTLSKSFATALPWHIPEDTFSRTSSSSPLKKRDIVQDLQAESALVSAKYSVRRGSCHQGHKRAASTPVNGTIREATHVKHLSRRTGGSAVDDLILAGLYVGSLAEGVGVVLDTGSSDLVLMMSSCSTCIGKKYDFQNSRSFRDTSRPFSLTYGDGVTVKGNVVTDRIVAFNQVLYDQPFGAITSASPVFDMSRFNAGGILGLGLPTGSACGSTPLFTRLFEESHMDPTFSIYLNRPGSDTPSSLGMGGIHPSGYDDSTLKFFPVEQEYGEQGFWAVQTDGFFYDSQRATSPFSAILDTGSTQIHLHPTLAKTFYDKIPGAEQITKELYAFPCDTPLPPITISIDGRLYYLDPDQFRAGTMEERPDMCVGILVATENLRENQVILGRAFLSTWFSVYDYGRMEIGLAVAT